MTYKEYMQKVHNIDILGETYQNYKESYKNTFKREYLNSITPTEEK